MLEVEYKKFLETQIFNGNEDRLAALMKLHDSKKRLVGAIKQRGGLLNPFLAEFSGSPRAGKTTCILSISEFFKKGGFNVFLAEEIANKVNQQISDYEVLKSMSKEEYNDLVAEETLKIFREKSHDRSVDILLFDRGILDRYIWYYALRNKSENGMENLQIYYDKIKEETIDFLCVTMCDPITSMKRDYLHSLTLEPRKNNNFNSLQTYNSAVIECLPLLREHAKESIVTVQTDNYTCEDVNIFVAENMIKTFSKKI